MKKAIIITALLILCAALIITAFNFINERSEPTATDDTYSGGNTRIPDDTDVEAQEDVNPVNDVTVSVEFKNTEQYPTVTQAQLSLISDYFTRYYTSLGNYTALDMNSLYYFDTDYERSLIRSMIDYQIRIRKNMDIDLTYEIRCL